MTWHDMTWCHMTSSHDVTWHDFTWHHAPSDATWRHDVTTWCHMTWLTWRHVTTSCHDVLMTSRHDAMTSRHKMWHHMTSWHDVTRHDVMRRHVMSQSETVTHQLVFFIIPKKFQQNYTRNLTNTRSSATAEKQHVRCPRGGGLGPPAHSPPLPLATPMRMVESETRNKRTSSVPSTKCTLRWIWHSRSFKVILIGAGPERCVVVMCN